MSEDYQKKDLDRLGLSEKSRMILDELVSDDYFKDGLSAYRLAISYIVYNKIDVDNHQMKRAGDMYKISQLDPESTLATIVAENYPAQAQNTYRFLEKCADLGIMLLKDEIDKNGSIVFWD